MALRIPTREMPTHTLLHFLPNLLLVQSSGSTTLPLLLQPLLKLEIVPPSLHDAARSLGFLSVQIQQCRGTHILHPEIERTMLSSLYCLEDFELTVPRAAQAATSLLSDIDRGFPFGEVASISRWKPRESSRRSPGARLVA